MRNFIDHILQKSIKLCLLTGVAFTFAACYGPPPDRTWQDEPAFTEDQQQVDEILQKEAEEMSKPKSRE